MANSTLEAIEIKMRRITRSPTLALLSHEEALQYINTFILYDFPQELRLFSLRTTLTFYTIPFVDLYETNITDVNNPLYNFKNKYTVVHPPVYIAGIQAFYTQVPQVFYTYYPQPTFIADSKITANGGTGPYSGTIVGHPILQRSLIISCLDPSDTPMNIVDYPVSNTLGALGIVGVPQTLPSPFGQVNYITGAFTVNFPGLTKAGAPIQVQNNAYAPGKSQSVLFYDNKFILRPVPIDVYPVRIEADIIPTELIESNQNPDLNQWWQYIAYGASKKLFEDRMDYDSIQMIMGEFKHQESLVRSASDLTYANEQTKTIYNVGNGYNSAWYGAQWPY